MKGRKWEKPNPRKKPNWYEPSEEEKVMLTFQGLPIPQRRIPAEQGWYGWEDARANPLFDIQQYALRAMRAMRLQDAFPTVLYCLLTVSTTST